MTHDPRAEGMAAFSHQLPMSSCPYPAGSAAAEAWTAAWTEAEAEPVPRADAPFDQVRGLTGPELSDVIGADDYEAGADDVPPSENPL